MSGSLVGSAKFLADVFLPADSVDEGTAERGQRNKRRVLGTNSVGEQPRRPTSPLLLPFCSASKFSLTFFSCFHNLRAVTHRLIEFDS